MKVGILGGATTKFGELWGISPRTLAHDALINALEASQLQAEAIDALFVGNMLGGILGNQTNLGSFFAEELGVFVPAFRLEGACASGGLALHTAINSILAGRYDVVMVLGIEKMTDHSSDEVTNGLMAAGSDEERNAGATFPGLYALIAQAYMQQYTIREESLAAVSVKNHFHGSLNPMAQFQTPISIESVMRSAKIADPIKLLDSSPISDGAAAIVLANEAYAKKNHQKPVYITASEVATDSLGLQDRETLVSLSAVVRASQKAYATAGITSKEIDVAEIHDCFSIAEAIANEDLGFSERGAGATDTESGKYTLFQGTTITNPSGGLKACGHPVVATGIKQVVEIAKQLRGEADKRQVAGAKIGLTHNVGGSGAVAAIHILQI